MPVSWPPPACASAGAASSAGNGPSPVAAAPPPEQAAATASTQSAAPGAKEPLLEIPTPLCITGESRTPARSTQGDRPDPLAKHADDVSLM
jgi:hypothetical protein